MLLLQEPTWIFDLFNLHYDLFHFILCLHTIIAQNLVTSTNPSGVWRRIKTINERINKWLVFSILMLFIFHSSRSYQNRTFAMESDSSDKKTPTKKGDFIIKLKSYFHFIYISQELL